MKVLVTGVRGQLGHDVVLRLAERGHVPVGVDIDEMDITDRESVRRAMLEVCPDAVIHCAAWTAVDAAEDDENRETVRRVNAGGTENIALACRDAGCKMMYISTDYVFDGTGTRPWEPDDARAPQNVYGATKAEGEEAVERVLDNHFIVRISWVFGVNGKNFIKTMLNLGATRDKLTVVADQVGSPTYTYDLARLLVDMIETDKYGRYHATNEGMCSWYEFACEIFRAAAKYDPHYAEVEVSPVTSDAYPAKAKRPANSRMSKEKLTAAGFERLPTWQDALARYLTEIEESHHGTNQGDKGTH